MMKGYDILLYTAADICIQSPKTLNTISIEMQLGVNKRLEKAKDRVALSGVSRHFRVLAGDPEAWKGPRNLVIRTEVPVEDACRLVQKFSPGVKSVSYTCRYLDGDEEDLGIRFLETLIEEGIKVRKLALRNENYSRTDRCQEFWA